jgi:tetratricopeptide (TPR) repeat protein
MSTGLARSGLLLLAMLSFSAGARADRGEARARAIYDQATAAFGLGHYEEAAAKYEQAFSLRPDPALLYDAAQAYRLGGDRTRAMELYRNYVRLYPDGSNAAEARGQAAALGKAIEAEKQAALAPPPASAPPPPAATSASLAAPVPGPAPVSETVAAGVSTSAPASPAAESSHTWIWIAAGAAVVAAATVAIVLATRTDKFPDATFGSAPGN